MPAPPPPEQLHADALASKDYWKQLSVSAAAAGDSFTALHAAWAADVSIVQAVLLERILLAFPDPEKQFTKVLSAIRLALRNHATRDYQQVADVAGMVLSSRETLALAFDESVMQVLRPKFIPVDHLHGLPLPDNDTAELLVKSRTNGQPLDTFIAQQLDRAHQRHADAVTLLTSNPSTYQDSITAMYESDMAAAEAHLVRMAALTGDHDLVSVHLRWRMICDRMSALPELPSDPHEAMIVVRNNILASVGTVDSERLQPLLLPLPQ